MIYLISQSGMQSVLHKRLQFSLLTDVLTLYDCSRAGVAEWFTAPCFLHAALMVVGSSHLHGHVCRYVDQKFSAAMLTSIQSAGVTPEVNLRITQARKHAKGIHPGFETHCRCHQKSKNRGISGLTKKTSKNLQKKTLCDCNSIKI